jgi:hypothetical protein
MINIQPAEIIGYVGFFVFVGLVAWGCWTFLNNN